MKSLVVLALATAAAGTAMAHPRPPHDFPDVIDRVPPHPPPPPPPPPAVVDVQTDIHAALTDAGDAVRLVTTSGGKTPGARIDLAKGKSIKLYEGDGSVATLKTAHGTTLIALSVDNDKAPFRLATFDGKTVANVQRIGRPAKQSSFPFAVAIAPTPDGFTAFFQEVETANPNEAHTYMIDVAKDGTASEAKEIPVPWALADAVWNGDGYHLALFYTGEMRGARLSMVQLTADGHPGQHPDWATQPSAITDVHLVRADGKIRAIYRGGVGDRMYATDVTMISQWGNVTDKTVDLGALGANEAIAITAKGQPMKVKTK